MTKAHVQAAAVRELPIDELCALIEDYAFNADLDVMERLVIGATAAPILVRHIRALEARSPSADDRKPTDAA